MYSPTGSSWGANPRRSSDLRQNSFQHSHPPPALSADMTESERKIITEFAHYLEKSKQLFNGLR